MSECTTEWKQKLPRPVFPGDFNQAQLDSMQRAAQMGRDNARRVVDEFFRARPSKPKPRRKASKLARRCAARGRG